MTIKPVDDRDSSLGREVDLVNVGIIGLGRMGSLRRKVIEVSGGKCVAVMDPNPDRLREVSGARIHRTAEDLISDSDVHAVFICTPNYLNKKLTIQSLEAGKHVFCEKPPAFNASEVEEVIAAEKKSCKKLMYGFNHRHHGSIIKAKEVVDSGAYGRILWMRGRYGKSVGQDFYETWRAKKEFAGGGILIDQGIHMLDLFLMMAGEFDEVHAFVSSFYWKLDVEDNVFAIFRNAKGVLASLHSTMTQWRHLFSFEIFMEKGSIIINGLLTPSRTYGTEVMTITRNRTEAPAATWSEEEALTFDIDKSWQKEVDCFLTAINGDLPIVTGNSGDALKLMRLVDQIYENG